MAGASNQHVKLDDSVLPATFRVDKRKFKKPSDDLDSFLEYDLSVQHLDNLGKGLWFAAYPGDLDPPRALSTLLSEEIQIRTTRNVEWHLVYTTEKIWIKALPRYVLSASFYDCYLSPSEPHSAALGLLHTYLALIATELDFAIARGANLVPPDVAWEDWMKLTHRVLADYPDDEISVHLSKRYQYGELSLSRLDIVSRYCSGVSNGYLGVFERFSQFLTGNFKRVAATFAYILLVLTAMQVGLATDHLQNNEQFQRACYGFTVFSLIGPLVAVMTVLVLGLGSFLFILVQVLVKALIEAFQEDAQLMKSSTGSVKV